MMIGQRESMKSILSRFAGPSPSSRGNVNDSMYRGKREYAKRKSPCPGGQRLEMKKKSPRALPGGLEIRMAYQKK